MNIPEKGSWRDLTEDLAGQAKDFASQTKGMRGGGWESLRIMQAQLLKANVEILKGLLMVTEAKLAKLERPGTAREKIIIDPTHEIDAGGS